MGTLGHHGLLLGGGEAWTPQTEFTLGTTGVWLYGWDNTDLKVGSDGSGGSVADGGTIGRWNDRSGGTNHVSQATANIRPVWKDGKVRCFWAVNTTTRQAYLSNAAISAIPRANCSGGFVIDPPGQSASAVIDLGASQLTPNLGNTTSSNYQLLRYFNGAVHIAATGTKYTGRKCVITFRSNGTNITWNVNGVDYVDTALSAVDMTRLWLGRYNGGSPKPMNYNEIVVFDIDIGATKIAQLRTYLLTNAADDDTRTVVLYGDSLTMGVGSETGKPWHDYVTNRSGSRWYSYGSDGGYLFNPHVTAANLALMKGSNEGVAVLWIGTNDIHSLAKTGAQTEASLNTYCTTLQAAGMKVVVCTLQDFATGRAEKDAFNTLLRANWATYADALVDLGAAVELDDSTDTTYYASDGVHLMDAGYAAAGALIQTAMASI